jgi:hypothetical protein
MDETFLGAHASDFENFWNRQPDDSVHELRYPGYGYEIHLETNSRAVVDAAHLAAGRYCRSNGLDDRPGIELQVMIVPSLPDTPVPADLPAILQTIGVGDTMFQAATPWVQWVTDLNARRSYAVISPALAAQPRLVSRYLLDRAVNNILLREGVGQLHSTTLVRDDCALLFIAPHGTGKSTTAFHLLNAGYRLMGDGLLFVREPRSHAGTSAGEFELMGYPVGEAKLTTAAQPLFPEWRGEGDEVSVHKVVKHIVNLRTLAPHKMIENAVFPKRVILCLAERNGQPLTLAERLDPKTALARVLPDTIQLDQPEAMLRSLNVLRRLIEYASCYRLTLGADRDQLVETIGSLA